MKDVSSLFENTEKCVANANDNANVMIVFFLLLFNNCGFYEHKCNQTYAIQRYTIHYSEKKPQRASMEL